MQRKRWGGKFVVLYLVFLLAVLATGCGKIQIPGMQTQKYVVIQGDAYFGPDASMIIAGAMTIKPGMTFGQVLSALKIDETPVQVLCKNTRLFCVKYDNDRHVNLGGNQVVQQNITISRRIGEGYQFREDLYVSSDTLAECIFVDGVYLNGVLIECKIIFSFAKWNSPSYPDYIQDNNVLMAKAEYFMSLKDSAFANTGYAWADLPKIYTEKLNDEQIAALTPMIIKGPLGAKSALKRECAALKCEDEKARHANKYRDYKQYRSSLAQQDMHYMDSILAQRDIQYVNSLQKVDEACPSDIGRCLEIANIYYWTLALSKSSNISRKYVQERYDKCIAADPSNPLPYLNNGEFCLTIHDKWCAVQSFEAAIASPKAKQYPDVVKQAKVYLERIKIYGMP